MFNKLYTKLENKLCLDAGCLFWTIIVVYDSPIVISYKLIYNLHTPPKTHLHYYYRFYGNEGLMQII